MVLVPTLKQSRSTNLPCTNVLRCLSHIEKKAKATIVTTVEGVNDPLDGSVRTKVEHSKDKRGRRNSKSVHHAGNGDRGEHIGDCFLRNEQK